MPLIRNTSQKSKSIMEFYKEAKNSDDIFYVKAGELMLKWVDAINSHFRQTVIWGLTSHDHLILQNQDDYTSDKYVILNAQHDEYRLEYLMPRESQPWDSAYVAGATKSLDEAMRMLKIAMRASKGWPESKEL